MGELVPCPICGRRLQVCRWPFLDGPGQTEPMVDCQERHHAVTDPQEWETRRVDARITEILDFLNTLNATPNAG